MFDDFTSTLDQHWTQTCIGSASLSLANSILRMALQSTQQGQYADAQIDDYGELARSKFPWKPPLKLTVCARSSLPAAMKMEDSTNVLCGTAGFGFWNYPFSARGDILMLPEAIWFFYASPPSNMALVPDSPGWGWKAQVIDCMRAETLLAIVPTALATGWALLTNRTRSAQRWLQRLSGAKEALLPADMTQWHTYSLEWGRSEALFWVDGVLALRVAQPPTRPLGFVAWIDNQYAVATPRGVLRFGTVTSGPQWLELDSISIEPL